ncbi:hypothetical protein L596_007296 [Steinernema carpocapsae]|uniref:Craniofacial development protein 1 n=1 Tax=Steinernema carpocapsae TaxID=34508 RepID=A0A4U5P8U3_STECR|nr:hypothetical protein L596_007296 [Steinernema carpocapsae]
MSAHLDEDDYNSSEDHDWKAESDDDSDDGEDVAGSEDDGDLEDEEKSEESSNFRKTEKTTGKKEDKSEEGEKDRIEKLWADFLADTDTPGTSSKPAKPVGSEKSKYPVSPVMFTPVEKVATKVTTEIFDFAGEEIAKSDETKIETPAKKISSNDSKETVLKGIKRTAAPSGLMGALNSMKKKKMSVLDKSDHDWNQFKVEKGISEELETHNKGKGGYVDRMEFLTRTDHQQFEREKMARQAARKNQ